MAPTRDDKPRPSNQSAYRTERKKEPSRREAQASASYRSALEKVFSGGGLPKAFQDRLGQVPQDPKKVERAERQRKVLEASSKKALALAVKELLQDHEPHLVSPEAWTACLAADSVKDVLACLENIGNCVVAKTVKKPRVLRARLETLAVSSDVAAIRSRAEALARILKDG